MRVRNIILAAAVAGVFSTASAALADSYLGSFNITWGPGQFSSGYGGEFGVYNLQIDPNATFVPATMGAGVQVSGFTFQTFCIQAGIHDVVFWPTALYLADITDHSTDYNGYQNPLTPATALLFQSFWYGNLGNPGFTVPQGLPTYNYTVGYNRTVAAAELQAAIWMTQGDFNNVSDTLGWVGLDSSHLANINALINWAKGNAIGIGDVRVLAIYTNEYAARHPDDPSSAQYVAQAQLIVGQPQPDVQPRSLAAIPLPSTAGGVMALLSISSVLYRRRRAR